MASPILEERLLSRATFGPRPGDREVMAEQGPEAWLAAELGPKPTAGDDSYPKRLQRFPSLGKSASELLADTALEASPMMAPGRREKPSKEQRQEIRQLSRRVGREVAGARLVGAVHGPHGLHEVMVDFWANHFSVDARKPMLGPVLPHYLQQVLRPHALGSFDQLLLANARSPAMQIYLDNWNSTAPLDDMARSQRRRRRRLRRGPGGINENYARELLELHTLGVHGGYDQRDVVEVARVFTGWSIESRRNPVYRFYDELHVGGSKRVLGHRFAEAGEAEGRRLLRRLALHPSTADHLATKLVQRFVADAPPGPLVERARRRYLESEGQISEVLQVILLSPEFADRQNRKLKTPLRLFASALRTTGGATNGGPGALRALERMGEAPFGARSPAGYPETARAWVDPGALLERMNLAFSLEHGRIPGSYLGRHDTWHADGLSRPAATRTGREARAIALASRSFQWT